MNRFFTLLLAATCLTAVGQVTYPYNPDGNADTLIGVTDMQDLLSTYGQPFFPSEILVGGQTLTSVLMDLQHSIDSLSAMSDLGGGSVLDMPIGTILPVASEAVPEGWVLCDGRELAIEDHQGLYDLIGTTYGAGDSAFWAQVFYPATTFNIPDLRGRTIIGANDMGGEQSEVIIEHLAQLGMTGGAEMHSLTESELPEHTHEVQYFRKTYGGNAGHAWNGTVGGYSTDGNPQWVSNSVVRAAGGGGDQPHNNMQPYIALNYMMKVQAAEDVVATLNNRIDLLEQQIFSSESVFEFQDFSASTLPNGGWGTVDERLVEVPTSGAFDIELTVTGGGPFGGSYVAINWGIEVSFVDVGSGELLDATLVLNNSSFEATTPGIVTYEGGFSGAAVSKYSRFSFDGLDHDEVLMVTRMGKWQQNGYNYAGWPNTFNVSFNVGVHVVPK